MKITSEQKLGIALVVLLVVLATTAAVVVLHRRTNTRAGEVLATRLTPEVKAARKIVLTASNIS